MPVTGQLQATTPNYCLVVNISLFDIAMQKDGEEHAILDADWIIVPRDAALPHLRNRISLEANGDVGSDQGIVSMETTLLSRLANAIDITLLH